MPDSEKYIYLADEVRDDLDIKSGAMVEIVLVYRFEGVILASVETETKLNSRVAAAAEVETSSGDGDGVCDCCVA